MTRAKAKAALLTRRELAALLGVHMMTVTKWERDGLPVATRGRKGKPSRYREVVVRAWLQEREEAAKKPGSMTDAALERARRERSQAILNEQTFALRNRDLLPREDVEHAWSAEVTAVRAKLLAWPATLADAVYRAATLDGLPGVERVLHEAVRQALRELSEPKRRAPRHKHPVSPAPPPIEASV